MLLFTSTLFDVDRLSNKELENELLFRAVLQRQEPGCIGPKHCDSKKLCRGCRLSKCLEMGMSRAGKKTPTFHVVHKMAFSLTT